jgi:hypothetical protein
LQNIQFEDAPEVAPVDDGRDGLSHQTVIS